MSPQSWSFDHNPHGEVCMTQSAESSSLARRTAIAVAATLFGSTAFLALSLLITTTVIDKALTSSGADNASHETVQVAERDDAPASPRS